MNQSVNVTGVFQPNLRQVSNLTQVNLLIFNNLYFNLMNLFR
ncbi:MAG: hypothetical protein RLZZ628_1447 [Bacteroidota bacterium]|jgi:hypothetical protein